jgi:hypothetical protein
MTEPELPPSAADEWHQHRGKRGPTATWSRRNQLLVALVVALIAAAGVSVVVFRQVLSKQSGGELVLTAATDPGANAFMPPAASPPQANTQQQPTLQPRGDGKTVESQPLPGNRDGMYGGAQSNSGVDRDKMADYLGGHPAEASAFVDALNSDPTVYWSGARRLTIADITTYLRELTPAVLRLDTRITNHGFDGAHFTTVQSVFQTGTSILVDAHGVPRVRGLSGDPLTAPIALKGAPKVVGAAWPGYHPGALAEISPAGTAITTFVLVDVVTGQAFNRPAGTTGTGDTPHTEAVAPPVPDTGASPTTGQGHDRDIAGTYRWHYLTYISSGQDHLAQAPDFDFPVILEGNTLKIRGQSGPLNPDGSFVLQGPNGPYDTLRIGGVFAAEGGRTVIRNGTWDDSGVHGTWVATKE